MTDHPENVTIHPDGEVSTDLPMDLLSHVLAQLRLTGDQVRARTVRATQTIALKLDMAHVIAVTEGAVRLDIDGGDAVLIGAGELLLLPYGPDAVSLSTSASQATFIDCSFRFENDSRRGTALALPPWIHIPKEGCAGWLAPVMDFVMAEASDAQPGAALMVSRLIDLVVIRTLRSWVHQGNTSGWLGGLVDARIARAVKAIHDRPRQRWSVDALAGIAGMSRSNFCDRFASLVGKSPQRYSSEWRLGLARELLGRRDARVGQVGLSVGYRSEAAFSRAYKAFHGHSPRAGMPNPPDTGPGPEQS